MGLVKEHWSYVLEGERELACSGKWKVRSVTGKSLCKGPGVKQGRDAGRAMPSEVAYRAGQAGGEARARLPDSRGRLLSNQSILGSQQRF